MTLRPSGVNSTSSSLATFGLPMPWGPLPLTWVPLIKWGPLLKYAPLGLALAWKLPHRAPRGLTLATRVQCRGTLGLAAAWALVTGVAPLG